MTRHRVTTTLETRGSHYMSSLYALARRGISTEAKCLVPRRTLLAIEAPVMGPRCAWQQWQRSAFVRVRSSVRLPTDSAQPCARGEQQRTDANAAPNRQAGGHWFEPSTAHRKALHKGFLLLREATRGGIAARIAGSWRATFSDAPPPTALARIPISGEIPAMRRLAHKDGPNPAVTRGC